MLAVVKTKRQPGIDILEVAEPTAIGPDEVLVEVAACGICGTDVHIYRWREEELPKRLRNMPLPVVIGHEVAGRVQRLGPRVVNFAKGDRVMCSPVQGCGQCYFCRQGRYNLCAKYEETTVGIERNGGFARLMVVPAQGLYKLPDFVSLEEVPLIPVLAIALHAAQRSRLTAGDNVAVLGPGPVGLLHGMVARLAGAASVVVVGAGGDEERLSVAGRLGLETVNISKQNLVELLAARTEGRGADLIFDCAGGSEAFNLAVAAVRKGGEVMLTGAGRAGLFEQNELMMKEMSIVGVQGYLPSDRDRAINLLAHQRVELRPLISAILPLNEAQGAFQRLAERKAVKIVLKP